MALPHERGRSRLHWTVGWTLLSAAVEVRFELGPRRNPFQKLPKRFPAMTVLRLLFRSQFGKSFLDRGKIEQAVVAEPVRSSRDIQKNAFGFTAKYRQCVAVAGRGNDAYKTSRTFLREELFAARESDARCWLDRRYCLPPGAVGRRRNAPNSTPGAPPSASTSRPESSARTISPAA